VLVVGSFDVDVPASSPPMKPGFETVAVHATKKERASAGMPMRARGLE
jgi:hypothetical protein